MSYGARRAFESDGLVAVFRGDEPVKHSGKLNNDAVEGADLTSVEVGQLGECDVALPVADVEAQGDVRPLGCIPDSLTHSVFEVPHDQDSSTDDAPGKG